MRKSKRRKRMSIMSVFLGLAIMCGGRGGWCERQQHAAVAPFLAVRPDTGAGRVASGTRAQHFATERTERLK